jgi:hypothetical protein
MTLPDDWAVMAAKLRATAFRAGDREVARRLLKDARYLEDLADMETSSTEPSDATPTPRRGS